WWALTSFELSLLSVFKPDPVKTGPRYLCCFYTVRRQDAPGTILMGKRPSLPSEKERIARRHRPQRGHGLRRTKTSATSARTSTVAPHRCASAVGTSPLIAATSGYESTMSTFTASSPTTNRTG